MELTIKLRTPSDYDTVQDLLAQGWEVLYISMGSAHLVKGGENYDQIRMSRRESKQPASSR